MKKRILYVIWVLMVGITLTACGNGEPATAPSVAENDKSAIQNKLNKTDSESETQSENKDENISETEDISEKISTDDVNVPVTELETESYGVNVLVAYFSRANENYGVGSVDVGNTQIIAEYIVEQVGADSFHIETVTPYPADYDECCDVAKQEQADNARPELNDNVENMDSYDIVFLGYPIWWGDMPMAVYTFMESYDFSDKIVIPFNTHEGSGKAGTYSAISSALKNSQVLDGMAIQGKTAQEFNSDTQQAVRDWLDALGF